MNDTIQLFKANERFYEILSLLRGMTNNLNQTARTNNRYNGSVRNNKIIRLLNQIQDYALMRIASDKLCKKYGLSVLKKEEKDNK